MFNLFGASKPNNSTVSVNSGAKATGEVNQEQLLKMLQSGAMGGGAPAPDTNEETARGLNASPGSPSNPTKIESQKFSKIEAAALEKLPAEAQKIIRRYVLDQDKDTALMSSDGNTIAVLSNSETAYKTQFNNGFFNRWFGWTKRIFGVPDSRYAVRWMNTKIESGSNDRQALALEPVNHVVAALKNGDYRALSIFTKNPEGKFEPVPAAIALVDSLAQIPDEVKQHEKLGPIATRAETAIAGAKGNYIIDQIIFNPDSALARNEAGSLSSLGKSIAEALFEAQQSVNEPARNLFLPFALKQADYAVSEQLRYSSLPWQHIFQNNDDKWANSSADEPSSKMTLVRAKDSTEPTNPELAYLVAWSQLTWGKEFPRIDDELRKLALDVPEANAKEILKLNDSLFAKPSPLSSEAPGARSLGTNKTLAA